ncbi:MULTISPECIES: LiaF transmembrane domain-containing protein [unclassified Carboxylicivirga]|uniref:LiaF transmembrane domain-containing protein n=1 Tax=Carboxylicivirga TaxID=1628153 RepID=UPI003D3454D3
MNPERNHNKRGLLGTFLIIIGVILLLGNLGYLPYQLTDILFRWPMIFVAIGIYNLLKKQYTGAIITLAIGGLYLLPHFIDDLSYRDIFKFWPVFLILIGVTFYFKRRELMPANQRGARVDEYIDEMDIFGGGVTQVESHNFKGGRVTAIFGGGEVYLDRCQLSPDGAVLDVAMIFGGSKIMVPRDWNVKTEVVSIFGGFADKRNFFADTPPETSRTLVIKGLALFGGGEIRSL